MNLFIWALQTFFNRLWTVRVEEGQNRTILMEEVFHVDHQIFGDREALERLNHNHITIDVFDQGFTGEAGGALNGHTAGSTYGMAAGTTIADTAVLLPFQAIERGEYALHGRTLNGVILEGRLFVRRRIVAHNAEGFFDFLFDTHGSWLQIQNSDGRAGYANS